MATGTSHRKQVAWNNRNVERLQSATNPVGREPSELSLWAHHAANKEKPRLPIVGPDHPNFYHRKFRNQHPPSLDLVSPNAEAALPLLESLPKNSRRLRITAAEQLLKSEREKLQVHSQAYERLIDEDEAYRVTHLEDSEEDARSASLAAMYRHVSGDLARVILLTGMLRRLYDSIPALK